MKGGKHLHWAKGASALAHFSRQWWFPQRLFAWSCSVSGNSEGITSLKRAEMRGRDWRRGERKANGRKIPCEYYS